MKKKTKKKEERYELTFKGLLYQSMLKAKNSNIDYNVDDILANIELHLRRHYSKDGCPAIIFDIENNNWIIDTVTNENK